MTTAERAQAAADFLNAGERWRVHNHTPAWPNYKEGRWLRYRVPPQHEPMKIGNSDYLTYSQVIGLATAEGWQENETQPATQTGAQTGQQIPFFDQVAASPTVPFQREYEDAEDDE